MEMTRTGISLDQGRFDEATATHRFKYDEDETPASMAAVAALAEVSGEDPTDLAPIQESVDSDALDLLAGGRSTDTGDVHVTWEQEDYTVTVLSDGVVAVGLDGNAQPAATADVGHR